MTMPRSRRPTMPVLPRTPACAAAILSLWLPAWAPAQEPPAAEPETSVAGQVVAPGGAPIPGATVEAWEGPRPLGAPTPEGIMAWGPVTAGEDGTFEVRGVAPGVEVVLHVSKEGYGSAVLRGIWPPIDEPVRVVLQPRAAPEADEGRLRPARPPRRPAGTEAGPGAEVSGRVLEPDGAPGRRRELQLAGGPTVFDRRTHETTADDRGEFAFHGVRDGKYRLTVTGRDAPAWIHPETVAVQEGVPVVGVDVRMAPTVTLTGLLLGLDADELRGAAVRAGLVGTEVLGSRHGEVLEDGTYRISGLCPGEWRVLAEDYRSGRQATGSVVLEAGRREARLNLEFGSGFAVTGSVFAEGEALPGAALRLVGLTETLSLPTSADYRGRFRIAGVPPGRYELTVSHPGFAPRVVEVEVVGGDVEAEPVLLERSIEP